MRCILIISILVFIITIMINIMFYKKKEGFITDYYDKYFNDLSIPTKFYETSAEFANKTHYAVEMNDRFFIDVLDKEKNILFKPPTIEHKAILVNKDLKTKMLKNNNKYLVRILNSELFKNSSNEKYIFTNVFSKVKELYQGYWENGSCIITVSEHILYRDTKIYGVSLNITTLYDIINNTTYIIDYTLNGFIFEDRIKSNVYPSNLIEDSYQEFMKDKIKIYDKKYEQKYVCKYLSDIKKFRGIEVDTQDLNCGF